MGGDRRAGAQDKREEKGGWEVGVLRWQEPGEIEKISQHFVIFNN